MQPVRAYRYSDPVGPSYEPPLQQPNPLGAEDIAMFVSGYTALRGLKGLAELGRFAWVYLLYGNNFTEAASFYSLFYNSGTAEGLSHELQNYILTAPRHPDRPVNVQAGGAVSRFLFNEQSEQEILDVYRRGLREANFDLAFLEDLRQRRINTLGRQMLAPGLARAAPTGLEHAYVQGVLAGQLFREQQRIVALRSLHLLDVLRRVGVLAPAQSDDVPATPAGSTDP